jgi:hypothetical protein
MKRKSSSQVTKKTISVQKSSKALGRHRTKSNQLSFLKEAKRRSREFLNKWKILENGDQIYLVHENQRIKIECKEVKGSQSSIRRRLLDNLVLAEHFSLLTEANDRFIDLLEAFGTDENYVFSINLQLYIFLAPKRVSVTIDENSSVLLSNISIKNIVNILVQADQNPELLKNWKNIGTIQSLTQAGISRSLQSLSEKMTDFKIIEIGNEKINVTNCLRIKNLAVYLSLENATNARKAISLRELQQEFLNGVTDISEYLRRDFERIKKVHPSVEEIFYKTFDRQRIFLNPLVVFTS